MKIVLISDTHSKHRQITIPDADTIICAGDITFKGELSVISDFADWMGNLPIKHKILIFGNHELGMERSNKRYPALQILKDANIHYLEDSEVIIDGIKFWGSPIQPTFYNWEFNRDRGANIKKHWDLIPDDTNVLITHGPPKFILDAVSNDYNNNISEHVGCEDLLNKIKMLNQLKLHVFGHIHPGYGIQEIANVKFVNASTCTEKYNPTNLPIVVEI